jgi:RNA polymerase sigma-70 factor (ECF subfamily)
VLRFKAQFRGESRFSTWLYSIVRNVCLDHLRKRSRENEVASEMRVDATGCDDSMSLDTSEMSATHKAFEALKPEQKRLLVLSRVEGIGYKEIARILGFSEGAVRVRIHRTLRKLKSDIARLEELET